MFPTCSTHSAIETNEIFSRNFLLQPGDRSKRTTTPILTAKRSFTARNTGELPIKIYGFYINGLPCEGYGFKVLDCEAFELTPNATKTIDIAFTPDFTLSRVERKLLVLTSVGPDSSDVENGVVMFNLLATLPAHSLDSCGSMLARPWWERVGQWLAIGLSPVLLMCVLVVSFIEADRILREFLASHSKESPVQPPLDLRLLSHISTGHATSQGGGATTRNEKVGGSSDERNKTRTKDDIFPDWSLMNLKKCKDKDVQKGLKIPDWSADEERRFKLDTESKDLLSFKQCEEPFNADNTVNVSNAATYSTKRKNNKKLSNIHEAQSDNCMGNDTLTDAQLVQEKKCTLNEGARVAITKSSPTSNRKGKMTTTTTTTQSSVKEESKLIDHEIQVDTGMTNNNRATKSDNKRKQTNSTGNNSNSSNPVVLKKLESTSTQRIIHLSEEETSSTTTESSTHDETTSCKVSIDCVLTCTIGR